jgi:hypothetical protein
MRSNIQEKAASYFVGEEWVRPFGNPLFAWWADQAVRAYRLATASSFLPGVETLRHLQRFYAGILTAESPEAAPHQPSRTATQPQNDLEDLRAAWQEFEEAKGDWSKCR